MSLSKLWMSENKKAIAIGAGILLFILVAFLITRDTSRNDFSEEWELAGAGSQSLEMEGNIEITDSKMIIDVKGDVRAPGIYEAEEGERVLDVILRAGGFKDESDAANLNLAEKLRDEMVIVVGGDDQGPLQPSSESTSEAGTSKININVATDSELQTLPGIGPSKAQSIVSYREENGSFQTIEDIIHVSGIGEKSLESLRDLIDVK